MPLRLSVLHPIVHCKQSLLSEILKHKQPETALVQLAHLPEHQETSLMIHAAQRARLFRHPAGLPREYHRAARDALRPLVGQLDSRMLQKQAVGRQQELRHRTILHRLRGCA